MTLEEIEKLNREEQNTLNLEKNLVRQLRYETDILVDEFLKKYQNQFDGPIQNRIIKDSNDVRKKVLNTLQEKCVEVIEMFTNDYDQFINKHGWYEHIGAGIRHKITKDELAYELCEVIRKVYYVYMEELLPYKYRIDIIEKYLLKEWNVSKN